MNHSPVGTPPVDAGDGATALTPDGRAETADGEPGPSTDGHPAARACDVPAPSVAEVRPCRVRVCGMHPAHRYVEGGAAFTCPGSGG